MEEEKQEKLPIDAKLLSDAVIELNISKRSVGLYPPGHPIRENSLKKAFDFLQKLFEIRNNITLGVAKDTLMIDEYVLDKKNPVYREFALSLHSKGIAAVTFYSRLAMEELMWLHELLVTKESVIGQALIAIAEKKGLKFIKLTPLDVTKFSFAEGCLREKDSNINIWENYIYGLLEGKLADDDAEGIILNIPSQAISSFLNNQPPDEVNENTYDRVITTYLKKKDRPRIRPELFSRFISLIDGLRPEMKQQFLKRSFSHAYVDAGDIEYLLGEITSGDIEKLMNIFKEHSSLIPESIENLFDKLRASKDDSSFFGLIKGKTGILDDIEINDNILQLFKDDHFKAFVAKDYQKDIEMMLKSPVYKNYSLLEVLENDCSSISVSAKFSDLLIELLDADSLSKEDFLSLLSKISEIVNDSLETGRFDEIIQMYNTIRSHSLEGRFRDEANSMLHYFFNTKEFILKLIETFKLWGRHDREKVFMLARVFKHHLITPMFDALSEEADSAIRKFLLQILSKLGKEIIPEAVKRLNNDDRWYIVRNMIFLIRETGGADSAVHIRKFAKGRSNKICIEAVKTLVHFKTPDAHSYIKHYLHGNDSELREQAVRLAGVYKFNDAVPHLLELLERKDIFGTEAAKILVVKALGDIGNPMALDVLAKLYNSKKLLYKAAHEELKVEIFRSLHNYPSASISTLLKIGLKSKNDEIRSTSENLLTDSRG